MIRFLCGLGLVMLGAGALSVPADAQAATDPPTANPVCARFEAQLANVNRGSADPARADLIRHAEEAVAKQQADLDRIVAQSRRQGCEGISGFFALFTGQSPQCTPLNSQVQQMRGNLDRMMSDLERLKSGNSDQEAQRRALIGQLAQNNCGEQYRTAAAAAGPAGFFDALFGGNVISPGGDGAPSGTFRTVCVRTCDGFYFPVSYSTAQNRFTDDQRSCQRLCPATEAALYSFRNPGEDINQAVSVASGQAYTELPNAFRYRHEVTPGCSCRRPGQTWADALKNADDATTLESGDIVVTDEKAKALSQAPQGKPVKGGATPTDAKANSATPPDAKAGSTTPIANTADGDSRKRPVRTVGPPFVAGSKPSAAAPAPTQQQ
jgi:hypothetical protein